MVGIRICHHNYSHLQKQGGIFRRQKRGAESSFMMLTGWNVPWAQVIFRSFGENNWSEHDGQFIFWALTFGTRAVPYQQVTLAGCRYCSYSTSVWWKVSQLELGREGVDVKVVGPVSFF